MLKEKYTQIQQNDTVSKQNIDNIAAFGLGLVDGIKSSEYFYKSLENSQTYSELEYNVKKYYDDKS
ncbi:hypothetical protein [Campylobacter pinnipediorum]|uniref:hypothetical protein n=1 Tax=Campylobacter pinnipediorum TaxID=1965231 RepID=UPI00084D0B81|nr:hypothetical protein [Campylobacter pinnipediorum]OPA78101.1 hypothetical protein BFG05_02505 [Campylobacter pinnipediorum subsp. pinnipediorum]